MRVIDFVPLVCPDLVLVCPLLQWIVHEIRSPFGSLIGMLKVKLGGKLVEPLAGDGVPRTGGGLIGDWVVKVYHSRIQV
jgi:hypothetical protein